MPKTPITVTGEPITPAAGAMAVAMVVAPAVVVAVGAAFFVAPVGFCRRIDGCQR